MDAANYELLVRSAHALASSRPVSRGGDPAGLATADSFNQDDLSSVKVAAGYAMEIYSHRIFNDLSIDITREEFSRIKSFTPDLLQAPDIDGASTTIRNFLNSVVTRYFSQPKRDTSCQE
jgi:hypothetical protein